jgi:hypothetical protein
VIDIRTGQEAIVALSSSSSDWRPAKRSGFRGVRPYVVLTLYPDVASATTGLGEKVLAKLSEAERAGWAWLVTRETVTTAEYQEAMDIPSRTAKFQLKRLTDLGLLRMVGAGRATRYEVVHEGK